jgi:hypothetical protein
MHDAPPKFTGFEFDQFLMAADGDVAPHDISDFEARPVLRLSAVEYRANVMRA